MKKLKVFLGVFLVFLAGLLIWSIYWGITPKNFSLIFNIKEVTPVSPLYYIKVSREYAQSKFVFGDEDSSYWYFTLAQKRLGETEILSRHNLEKAAKIQARVAQKDQDRGVYYLNKLINKINVNYLIALRDTNQKELSDISSRF